MFCFSNYFSAITFCIEIKLCIKTLYNKVEAGRRADPASRLTLVCGAVADADDRSVYAVCGWNLYGIDTAAVTDDRYYLAPV